MSRIVPQLPNNSLTPNAISVPTTAGFAAGDLVYFNGNNGDYGPVPNAAIASASVDIVQNAPIYNSNAFNSFYQFHNPISFTTDFQGANNSKQASAILTNGNIVTVWSQNSPSSALFQIKTPAGAVVVSATLVGAPYTPINATGPIVSVIALSGGGFVMFFTSASASQNVVYAVYNNAGTVVTAWQNDVSFGTHAASSNVSGVALPNGRFVFCRQNDSQLVNYRIYEANGTGAFPAVTAPVLMNDTQGNIGIAARSDNSFLLFYNVVNSTTFQYIIVSSTNTVIATASFTGGSFQRGAFCGATCLTNDTFVLAFQYRDFTATFINPFVRLIPVGNTLGSEIAVGPNSLQLLYSNSGSQYADVSVKNLLSGGFICAWNNADGSVNYNFFNSLGQVVSATAGNYPRQIISFGIQNYNLIDLLEYNGAVVISANYRGGTNNLFYPFVRVSTTNFDIIPSGGSISSTLGSVSVATGNYLPSVSTPSSATFVSATSSISAVTVPLSGTSSFVVNPSTIQAVASNSIASATLLNGNFVIVTKQTSSNAITAFVYSPSGGLLQTIPVGTGVSNNFSLVKVAAMSSGGFVVSFYTVTTNPSTIRSQVYSSSYTLINTSDITGIPVSVDTSYGLGVCGLSNDRFAVGHFIDTSNNPIFRVFNSSGTQLFQSSSIGYGSGTIVSINSDPITGTSIALSYYRNNSGTYAIMLWRETSLNSWSNYAAANFTGSNSTFNTNCAYLPNGNILTGGASSSTGIVSILSPASNAMWGGVNTTLSNNSSGSWAVGCTGFGTPLSFSLESANTGRVRVYSTSLFNNTGTVTGSNYAFNGFNDSTTCMGITPGVGYRAVLTYLNPSNFPTFAIINAYPFVQTSVITAGVTPTSPTPLFPNKFVLAGVAANTATAGGSGNLIVNGNATLNTNYSSTTPAGAFDFQNAGTFGVKGTIAGRNVNLQGNNS